MMLPAIPTTVPVAPLIAWMLVLTVKHIICDFVLQNSWMAMGKDARTGWALPLLVHCAIHGAMGKASEAPGPTGSGLPRRQSASAPTMSTPRVA